MFSLSIDVEWLALEVSRAGASRKMITSNNPKPSYLDRLAAVLSSALKVAKVGVDFFSIRQFVS